MTPSLALTLLSKVSALWNMYGPTEATIWCSLKQIQPNEPITVGRPITNTQMFVMDSSFNVLPPFVKGELYISGDCLAEGYINNEVLTKERFIWQDRRLYKVGDIACTTDEDEFIIFGRTDNQIKLHGYRIELEDIESQIQNIPGIRQCAVTVFQEQLVAYLSLFSPESFSEIVLFDCLQAKIPKYMLPNRVIVLNQIPMTVSGKIDRHHLPAPTSSPFSETTELIELSPIQLLLIRIWMIEFGLHNVGLHDNFFNLGGHSLIAARIVLAIYQQTGKKIKTQEIYRSPTIAELSDVIARSPNCSLAEELKEETELILSKSVEGLFYQAWRNHHPPLLKAKLFYLQNNQVELQISLAHYISDEDSLSIFFAELANAYDYYTHQSILNAKEASHLFIKDVLYEKELMTKATKTDAAFWGRYMQEASYLCFPFAASLKRNDGSTFSFTTHIEIPEDALSQLKEFCARNRVTVSDAFCAAIGIALKRYGEKEIIVPPVLAMNILKSKRDNPIYDKVMGCFLNLYIIKLDFNKGNNLIDLAKQIQDSTLETIEYQRAPYFVKLAAVGRKTKRQLFLISLFSAVFSKFASLLHLNPTMVKACMTLGLARPAKGFLLNVNMLSNFFSTKQQEQILFGAPIKPIPRHPNRNPMIENVLDFNFYRNEPDNKPYVAITSNLNAELREGLGRRFLEVLQLS